MSSYCRIALSVALVSLWSAQAGSQTPASAHAQDTTAAASDVIVVHAAEITWRAGPPSLPAGAEFALLEGDPSKAEPLTLRLRFPANYVVPPHWHSVLEHVTVLRGTLHIGMGETLDRSAGVALTAGSYGVLPVGMVHHAWTGADGVTFQLHSVGPWTITYVNESDDPRRRP